MDDDDPCLQWLEEDQEEHLGEVQEGTDDVVQSEGVVDG